MTHICAWVISRGIRGRDRERDTYRIAFTLPGHLNDDRNLAHYSQVPHEKKDGDDPCELFFVPISFNFHREGQQIIVIEDDCKACELNY